MNLVHLHEGPQPAVDSGSKGTREEFAIAGYVLSRVFPGDSEIKLFATVFTGNATLPGAEAVRKPGNSAQRLGPQNIDTACLGGRADFPRIACRALLLDGIGRSQWPVSFKARLSQTGIDFG